MSIWPRHECASLLPSSRVPRFLAVAPSAVRRCERLCEHSAVCSWRTDGFEDSFQRQLRVDGPGATLCEAPCEQHDESSIQLADVRVVLSAISGRASCRFRDEHPRYLLLPKSLGHRAKDGKIAAMHRGCLRSVLVMEAGVEKGCAMAGHDLAKVVVDVVG